MGRLPMGPPPMGPHRWAMGPPSNLVWRQAYRETCLCASCENLKLYMEGLQVLAKDVLDPLLQCEECEDDDVPDLLEPNDSDDRHAHGSRRRCGVAGGCAATAGRRGVCDAGARRSRDPPRLLVGRAVHLTCKRRPGSEIMVHGGEKNVISRGTGCARPQIEPRV